jgi:integrase
MSRGRDPHIRRHWFRDSRGNRKETKTWYLRFHHNGKEYFLPTGTESYPKAAQILKETYARLGKGEVVGPQRDRLRFEDLAALITADYRNQGRKSLHSMTAALKRLGEVFAGWKASAITHQALQRYVDTRRAQGRADGTIRVELAVLRRSFHLAARTGQGSVPVFPTVKAADPRTGFFEWEEYQAVLQELPPWVQPVVTFLYYTGWRLGEVLGLTWAQVDFSGGVVRLEAGTTKNGAAREFPFARHLELAALLQAQRERTKAWERAQRRIIPMIFHHDGTEIRGFRRAWASACQRAGLQGRIPHDFRRTAVRNLVRAGVSERVAMTLTGHKTRAVFDRYDICSAADRQDAVQKLAAYHRAQPVPIVTLPTAASESGS